MALSGGGNIKVKLASGGAIHAKITSGGTVSASVSADPPVAGVYEGPYTVTPSQETQTLSTERKISARDIIINPIPSCYGLITWDGSVLTVS